MYNRVRRIGSKFPIGLQAKIGIVMVAAVFLLVLLGPFFVHYSPYKVSSFMNDPPSLAHPFGTDNQGHDLLSQVIYGSYASLIYSLLAAFGATLIGLFAGMIAGYYHKFEVPIGGITDVVMSYPAVPLLILIGTIFLPSDFQISIVIMLILWAPVARAVRTQTLAVKKFSYVDSSRVSGLSNLQIIRKVVLLEVSPIAIAYFIINISVSVIFITAIQFLGVGNPLIVSWGSILYWAQQYGFNYGDWWWVLAPGLVIVFVTTGFALVGFWFEERANPRLRRS